MKNLVKQFSITCNFFVNDFMPFKNMDYGLPLMHISLSYYLWHCPILSFLWFILNITVFIYFYTAFDSWTSLYSLFFFFTWFVTIVLFYHYCNLYRIFLYLSLHSLCSNGNEGNRVGRKLMFACITGGKTRLGRNWDNPIKAKKENLLCMPWYQKTERWMCCDTWWSCLYEMDWSPQEMSSCRGLQCLIIIRRNTAIKLLSAAMSLQDKI